MKPVHFLLVFLSITLLGLSCKKEEDLKPGFNMLYQQNFIIPVGISEFVVHHFQFENLPTNYEQYLKQADKTDADVTAVFNNKAAITGIYGDANLDFIDQVSVRVFDQANETDYVEVAYRYPVPFDPGNSLPLIPSLADSKRFFSKNRFAVDVVIWLRKTTLEETEVRLDMEMRATL